MHEPRYNPDDAPIMVDATSWYDPDREARRILLKRLRLLLLAGVTAFTLLVWGLVRIENPLERLGLVSGPRRIVRTHLAALSRGEARAAYDQFSAHYRAEIPWPAYQRLVASHRDLFRTQVLEFRDRSAAGDRSVLDADIVASNGRRYVARFTLVQFDGRWWIDSIRWSQAPDPERFLRT